MRAPVNGIEIEYRVDGRVKAPAVVLSHSLATHMAMWNPQVAALARDYLVVSYDMRGHGLSDAPAGPYDFAMLANDVVGLLDHLDIDRAAFIGISIGGMIGQALAIHHPRRLSAAVLCSTTSQISEQVRALWDQRIAAVEAGGMAGQVAATLERWFTEPFRAHHPDTLAWVGEMIRATPVAGFIGCGRAIQNLSVAGDLGRVATPTLVLPGEKDPGMPPAVSEVIQRAITGARLAIVPNASHLSNIEQPEAFNRQVGAFLAEHAAA
jgi:3-oxoadipate enol-lactonase